MPNSQPNEPAGGQPLDFSAFAIPLNAKAPQAWSPPPGDKLDFSSQAVSPPPGDKLDFSSQAVPASQWTYPKQPEWFPPPGDVVTSKSPLIALRNSAGQIVAGVGHMGDILDQAIARHLPAALAKALGATGDLQSGTDQAVVNAGNNIAGPVAYQPAPVHQLGADIEGGKPLAALNDAAGIVAGAVPYAAAAAIPGAGPVLLGSSGAGNTIDARMRAQAEAAPSLGDIGAGAVSGAVNAVGGGVAHGATDGLITPALVKALGPQLAAQTAARLALRAGTSGAVGGALGAANNVLDNAGTGNLTFGGVGSAALEGAGTGGLAGGAMSAAGSAPAAAKGAMQSLGDNITARANGPLTDDAAASVARIVPDLQRFSDRTQNIRPDAPLVQKVAGYSKALTSQTLAMGNQIAAMPGMPDGVMSSVIRPLVSAAAAHNNAVPGDLRAQFNALPVDTETRATFNAALDDLDTLSQSKLTQNQVGPFASIGGKIGGLATTAAMLPHDPVGAVLNAVAGSHLENAIGARLGGVTDSLLGTNQPLLMARARMAIGQTRASGQPIGPSSLDATAGATARLMAANAAANDTTALQATQSLMRPTAAALAMYGPDHPVGQAAWQQLQDHGVPEMADQAVRQFVANQPVNQAKADVANQTAADARNAADAQRWRRADAAAALAPVALASGKADNLAAANQATLDAGDLMPRGGPGVGLTAINAAVNQLGRQADNIRAIGGQGPEGGGDAVALPQATQGGGGGVVSPSAPMGAPAAPSGPPRAFMDHLIARAGDEYGVGLTPQDIHDALTTATASGTLTPFDHDWVSQNLGNKLESGTGFNTANILLHHAVAAKAAAGVPVRGLKGNADGGASAGNTGQPNDL